MVKNILLVLMSVGPAVAGQLVLKTAITRVGATVESAGVVGYLVKMFTTPLVLAALGLYGISSMIWMVVLSKLDLSLAYPMVSMAYVLVVFLSWLLLKEPVGWVRIAGLLVICAGVVVISKS